MSITTNAELKTAIASWLARSDLTTYLQDFITLGTQRIYYGSENPQYPSEPLRIRAMETNVDITIDAETEALPTRFLGVRNFYLNTNPKTPLDPVTPETRVNTYAGSTTGKPLVYSIEADNFVFGPAPDATYTGKLLYYQKPADLSADADTNTVLTSFPGLYLYSALLEAMLFIRNDGRLPLCWSLFQAAANAAQGANVLDRYSSGQLVVKTQVGNP